MWHRPIVPVQFRSYLFSFPVSHVAIKSKIDRKQSKINSTMLFKCRLPCCTATEDKPIDFKPCAACNNTSAHHICSITTVSELDYEDNLLKADLEANVGVQFCSMICASEHNNNLKANKEADDVIRNEDMKDDEKYLAWAMRGATTSESRVLGAMAIGLQVSDGKGGKDFIIKLEDKYWTAAINKPTVRAL